MHKGRVAGLYTHGLANIATQQPVTATTMYEIDSIQKVMTAVMVMRQIRAGKLRMTTTLHRFFPKAPNSRGITIRQLLDMTSGLTYPKDFRPAPYHGDLGVVNHAVAEAKQTATGNGTWHYSGLNFVLLSGILIKLTGQTYAQLFATTFSAPLHLTHTRFAYETPTADMATGYHFVPATKRPGKPFVTGAALAHGELGTGQVYMDAADLYRVEAAIQTKLLTPAEKQVLFTPGSVSTYGGGLYHRTVDAANGYGYGFQSHMRISHNGQDAVIVMNNSAMGKPLLSATVQLTQMYLP